MNSINSKPSLFVQAVSFACILFGIAADQLSKIWVLKNLPGNEMDIIPGFLSFQYAENRNMAFGLGSSIPPTVKNTALIVVTSLLACALMAMMWRCRNKFMRAALILVSCGAVGNIIDRIRLGYVVDFIRWYGGFRWPNFNVADSFICIGVGLLLISSFRGGDDLFSSDRESKGNGASQEQNTKEDGAPKS